MNKEDGKAGNNSVFDVLSNVSGLSKDTIYDIAKKVKENQKKLEACYYHNFQSMDKKLRYKCTNCKGEIDSINKSWYELGIEHGKRFQQPQFFSASVVQADIKSQFQAHFLQIFPLEMDKLPRRHESDKEVFEKRWQGKEDISFEEFMEKYFKDCK